MGILKKKKVRLPPKYLDSPLRLLAVSIEAFLEKAYRTARSSQGNDRFPLTIKKHNALGFPGGIVVQGRVMATMRLRRPQVDDSAWVNLSRMLRHWLTDEEPFAKVEVSCGDETKETTADDEGYFEVTFHGDGIEQIDEVKMRLPGDVAGKWRKTGVLAPADHYQYLIISDVDDTILETNAASIWKMIKTTLFGNVLTRQVFSRIPEFYLTLLGEGNPFFYVTSSPWNLRGFMQSIFERYQIPKGGFFMTDWGLDKEKWFAKSHRNHKIESIQKILDWYPKRPVILLGDSGQKDPEIYREIAENYPERVHLVLIRNVSSRKRRRREVEAMAEECRAKDINFFFCDHTQAMEEAYELCHQPLEAADVSDD